MEKSEILKKNIRAYFADDSATTHSIEKIVAVSTIDSTLIFYRLTSVIFFFNIIAEWGIFSQGRNKWDFGIEPKF